MEIWVGADWDSEKCVIAVDVDGERRRERVHRTPDSVRAFMARWPGASVTVGLECGDTGWVRLWRSAGAQVVVFNGLKVRRYMESLTASGASDDNRSATALVEMVQSPSHVSGANVELSLEGQALTALLEMHDDASKDCVRYGNRLMSLLRNVHPAFLASLKKGMEPLWVVKLLQVAPTPRAWSELSREEQLKLFKKVPRRRLQEFSTALADDYGLVPEEQEATTRARIRGVVTMLLAAREVRATARARLDERAASNETIACLRPIRGAGPVVAAAVAVALDRVDDSASVDRDRAAKRFAVAPVTKRSGVRGDRAPLVAMRRASSELMRRLGHILGAQLVRNARWAKAQHAHNRQRGHRVYASYRRIARSFLRVLIAMMRDGTQFDEERYIRALKAKGVDWAKGL